MGPHSGNDLGHLLRREGIESHFEPNYVSITASKERELIFGLVLSSVRMQ
jgi:hypothetical protein